MRYHFLSSPWVGAFTRPIQADCWLWLWSLWQFTEAEGEKFKKMCAVFCENQSRALERLRATLHRNKDHRLSQILQVIEPSCSLLSSMYKTEATFLCWAEHCIVRGIGVYLCDVHVLSDTSVCFCQKTWERIRWFMIQLTDDWNC